MTKQKRKQYTEKFESEAIKLVLNLAESVPEISEQLVKKLCVCLLFCHAF